MTDLSLTIAPKSDQINADDLISGPRTIRITRVSANPESAEQPVSIFFDGDNGKPYRPCKSMRRVMVQVWGKDGNAYAGRSMTLYRDPEVQFGGMKVGGIRISHMSHIERDVTMALTATRANRKPFTVRVLKDAAPAEKSDKAAEVARKLIERVKAAASDSVLRDITAEDVVVKQRAWLDQHRPELAQQVSAAITTALDSFEMGDEALGEMVPAE